MKPAEWWDDSSLDEATNDMTYRLNGAAFEVHSVLGPGLPEKIYQDCLEIELRARGFAVDREHKVRPEYKGTLLNRLYKADFLINGEIVIEVKVVTSISGIDVAQAIGYLRLLNKKMAIIYNFNVASMKVGGVRRVLNPRFDWNSASSANSASEKSTEEG